MTLEVAQHHVSLVLSDPLFFQDVAKSYGGFLSDGDPKAVIQAHIVNSISQARSDGPPVIFDERGMSISDTPFEGAIDLVKGRGSLQTMPKWLLFALKVFLRYVFIFLHLRNGNGLVLHALGVLKEGEVYVFFGPSGSGKTTAATLSKGHTILSDDLVFLQYAEGSHWVYPTPPWGDMQRGKRENRAYPLKAVFKLIKSTEIAIRRGNPAQALADILTIPHLPTVLVGTDTLLSRFLQLIRAVPYYDLHFTKDRSFWPCVDENLRTFGIENAKYNDKERSAPMENKIPVKSPSTSSQIIDGEAVVIVPSEQMVNVLNSVGCRIWDLADGRRSIGKIAEILTQEFDVSCETALNDAIEFTRGLVEQKMMEFAGKNEKED